MCLGGCCQDIKTSLFGILLGLHHVVIRILIKIITCNKK